MALARDSTLGDLSSPGSHGFNEGDVSEKPGGVVKNLSLSNASSPSSGNPYGFTFRPENYQPEEAHSLINFKSGYDSFMHPNASVLSFEQNEKVSQNTYPKTSGQRDDDSMWESNLNPSNQWNQMNSKYNSDPRLMEDFTCFDTASNHGDWLYTEVTAVTGNVLESGSQDAGSCLKRPHMGESPRGPKKQCTGATKKPGKPKSVPSKDPQSIAAKNRRERISERLKTLQELVPNGSKVDLVTMLEKAISYVKFLQLQVKVLATDEFWPIQGGKPPDITQVREAIDAIQSSQRDRNSSSKQS